MRIIILLLVLVANTAFALTEFKLDFKLPKGMKLQLMDNQEDANGYTRRYHVLANAEINPETISLLTITHGRNVRLTPKESMAEIMQVHQYANCSQKDSHLIKLFDSVIIFSTTLDHCANGKSLKQIYKSFTTASGQYGINYSANPQTV